ncbi:hypothetical protein F5883DRAFT_153322 [Diaporthe sp. PMI_573]|nr:hypothetical protein F5883DRAFT_153322 [Diaporthaceae sp. PMI_573]
MRTAVLVLATWRSRLLNGRPSFLAVVVPSDILACNSTRRIGSVKSLLHPLVVCSPSKCTCALFSMETEAPPRDFKRCHIQFKIGSAGAHPDLVQDLLYELFNVFQLPFFDP